MHSSTNKIDCNDITEILLKVVLNTNPIHVGNIKNEILSSKQPSLHFTN
jgi:hypothetical protein